MEQLIDLIYSLKTKCLASEHEIMAEFGLSPAEYNGIAAMTPKEKVCGTEVSEKMHLSPSRASRVVDRMVKNGYLIRKEDSKDRRKCTIYLAKKGVEIKKKIEKIRNRCETNIRKQLSEDEINSFAQSVKKITDLI